MLRHSSVLLLASLVPLAACSSNSGFHSPFEKPRPFVATPVPADFAVVIDENHDTFYARQHIQQTITAADAMSTTTYTTYRDLNNTVSNHFSQETPLSAVQLQNMWNDVAGPNLLHGSTFWVNWLNDSDLYRRNTYTVQLRANGQTRSYHFTNGSPGDLRPLLLQTDAVRLPISQDSKTMIVGQSSSSASATSSTTEPVSVEPATAMSEPATRPATQP